MTTSKGDVLVKARRKLKLSRAAAAERLHVDVVVLKAFDDWNFEDFPDTPVPAHITLRRYSRLVDVVPTELERSLPKALQAYSKQFKNPRRLFFVSRFGYGLALGVVVVAFLSFLSWRTIRANAIPELNIYTPQQNAQIVDSLTLITGSTSEGAQVFINGVSVPVDTSGEFSGSVVLQDGPNVVEIRAINSFARERVIERVIIRSTP